ncbi:MAG TPA: VF530 family protein [Opitutaceae bacterium]|nr:VF530 family protein [Opitutaceae bacterium]
MSEHKSNDPLHGVTLEKLLTELVAHYGWRELASRVEIRCFMFDPSIKSSLTFLRKNAWARAKVEEIWVGMKSLG